MEDLQTQVTTLEAEKTQLLADKETLTTQLKAEQEARLADNQVAQAIILDLKTQLEEGDKKVARLPTVKVGKETYELVGGDFNYKGDIITAQRLQDDKKLAELLLKEGFGNLRKIEA